MEIKTITTDVLIIGSGGAGCRAAIEVSNQGKEALIVSKGLTFRSGCTGMAEGGYNAALGLVDPEDSVEAHIKDTLKGGSYLNDPKLVDILINESPDRLHDLEEYGALFDRQESGELNQRPFGGQTYRRTCFQGDRTGHEIMTALKEEIIKRGIKTIDEVMITALIKDDSNNILSKVIGAVGLDLKNNDIIYFQAKAVVLATGGSGQLFPVTSNTTQKNGDGFALAWNVGADLIDMEEIQFHPTGMVYPDSRKGVLVTEAVRAEGGRLINSEGERFMGRYDDRMELATRDVVARSIYNEIMEGRGTEHGGVYLDVSHLDPDLIDEKLETIDFVKSHGINVCSGGIFGLGETFEDRIDLALTLRDLGVKSIPINILNPIKGTPVENNEVLSYDEGCRIIAIFRFINTDAFIRLAGGRLFLEDKGVRAFKSGANATISGNMLTTAGISIQDDFELLEELGFEVGFYF